MITSLNELKKVIYNQSKIVLYGAGYVSRILIRYCEINNLDYKINKIVISKKTENDKNIKCFELCELKECSLDNVFVLIATRERSQEEIVGLLKSVGKVEYECMTDACIDNIEEFCSNYIFETNNRQLDIFRALEIVDVHKNTFGEYENKHMGDEMVVVATGPSLQKYNPIENAIHIGVNTAYKFENIDFKYYFVQDYSGKSVQTIQDIEDKSFIKFYGNYQEIAPSYYSRDIIKSQIPETKILEANAKKYFLQYPLGGDIHRNIKYYPIMDYASVVFSALQFALFCNPKRIYLVGCDCSEIGYFNAKEQNCLDVELVYKGYCRIKEFVKSYYPETEIVSINPVGLKGLFSEITY